MGKRVLSKAELRAQLEAALANYRGPVNARRHRRRSLIELDHDEEDDADEVVVTGR